MGAILLDISLRFTNPITQAQILNRGHSKWKSGKRYGIAKAGNNDCQSMSSTCAGTSKRDRQADAWIYLSEGICGKVAGGVVKAKRG